MNTSEPAASVVDGDGIPRNGRRVTRLLALFLGILSGLAVFGIATAGRATAGEEGSVRWRVPLGSSVPSDLRPAVGADGTIYAVDSGNVTAVASDGTIRWSRPNASGGHPVAIGLDGTLYTAFDDLGTSTIVALDPVDGSPRWSRSFPGTQGIVTGPGVGPDGNVYAVVDTVPEGVGAVSLDPDGAVRWTNPGSPALHQNGGGEREMIFGADRFYVALAGRSAPPALRAFAFDGEQLWYRGTGCESLPTLDPTGRVVVIGDGTCGVTTLEPDGEEAWNAPLPEVLRNDFLVLPAVGADGSIYTNQKWNRFRALRPDGSTKFYLDGDHGFMKHLGVTPDDRFVLDGGLSGPGLPGRVRAYHTEDGSPAWQVDLPSEDGRDFTVSSPPAFSPDGSVAYVHVSGTDVASYLYAIGLGGDPEPVPSIVLAPQSTTVAPGGTLVFDVTVANPGAAPVTFDGWLEVALPGGAPWGGNPLAGPRSVTLARGSSVAKKVRLRIPARVSPSGPYTMTGIVGTFPGVTIDASSFEFTVE